MLSAQALHAGEAQDIVRAAIDYWRGTSSYGEMTMTIHRPDWERSMSMRAWTQGEDRSRDQGSLIDDGTELDGL
jgi:hypothetical protein